jgi:tellurite resistance protein
MTERPARPPAPPIPPLPRPPGGRAGGGWRQTPPAIFPPILGLLGLGLAWRAAAAARPEVPAGLGEAILGAAFLLWLGAALIYGAKLLRRPAVAGEDLRVLPGQSGLAAALMGAMAAAVALEPYGSLGATVLAAGGLALHLALGATMAARLAGGPAEARAPNPVWHMLFVGGIVGGLAFARLGLGSWAVSVLSLTLPPAVAVWALSARALWLGRVPPPLRPLLAINLAPAALFASVASVAGLGGLAAAFGVLALGMAVLLAAGARWLTAAGFSPMWGAFTFPLAAAAGAFLQLGGPWLWPGAAALLAASVVVPHVAVRVLRGWAAGTLGPRTGAAVA